MENDLLQFFLAEGEVFQKGPFSEEILIEGPGIDIPAERFKKTDLLHKLPGVISRIGK